MPEKEYLHKRTRLGKKIAIIAMSLPFMLAISSCTSPESDAEAVTDESSTLSENDLGECGIVPEVDPQDPDGAVKELPEDLQAAYSGYPEDVYKSAWADLEESSGPYKVGLSYLPPANPFGSAVIEELDRSFEEAKEEGLVEGELLKQILPDPSTMTPAEQIRGFEELVRQDVDVILTTPLSGTAMVDAVNQAGEQGIVTVSLSATIPSPYAVNVADNSYLNIAEPAAEVMKQLGGKGDVIIVRGVSGVPTDQYGYDAAMAVIEDCPEVNVVGEVNGDFVPSAAQSALLQFLTSHPGEVDAVIQIGTMGSGVYSAFEQTGRPFPKVVDAGAQAASLAYWKQASEETGYTTAGTGGNGTQQARAIFEVAMRVLQGEGPKVATITRTPSMITEETLDEYLVPNADTSSTAEILDGEPWMESDYLDEFFADPGN